MTLGIAAARVLTVEDDPIVRADLRLILEDAGFEVAEARDGIEAVEQARRHVPDLILLDLGLPKLDGVEAARRILREREVPIVALTGRSNTDEQRRAVGAGATVVVLKPFSERELVSTVREALVESEVQHDHLRVMIDLMLREGRSEREVENAVRSATGRPALPSAAARAVQRIREWLAR